MPLRSYTLRLFWLAAAGLLILPAAIDGRKFYPDDPLREMPPPMPVEDIEADTVSGYYEFLLQTFNDPGERQPPKKNLTPKEAIPAQAVNTLGEVPDSSWFTNRIGSRPMPLEELRRGPLRNNAPIQDRPWRVVSAKTSGITPGFNIEDAEGRRYLLKFDPMGHREMTTHADFLGVLFFHALGYNVPENYLVDFYPDQLAVQEGATITDVRGRERPMDQGDIDKVLEKVPRGPDGRIRGLASLYLQGKPLGPFRYYDTRPDDPNDIYPHEHRRDLRGLFVFSAWLGHDDARALNSLDMLVEENGVPYVKHHLIDFGSMLGSASVFPNPPRGGHEYLFEWGPAIKQAFSLGLAPPDWARLDYKDYPSLGRFDYRIFDPGKWKPDEPNPAFENRLPDDTYWGAKKVMAFSDEQIAAVVGEANYSDPEAESWLIKCLVERRDRIGRTYFAKVLPVDNFHVDQGRLEFEDLEIKYGFRDSRDYQVAWSRFDNEAETHDPIAGAGGFELPAAVRESRAGDYFAAKITGEDPAKTATVFLRREPAGYKVAGVERTW